MVFDLYNAKAGDVVNLSIDQSFLLSNIYAEALSYNLVPYIEYADLGKIYVARLVNSADSSVAELSHTLARATLNQDYPVIFDIPDCFNIPNLIRTTRRAMCNLGMKGTHTLTGSLLTLSHKPDLVDTIATLKALKPGETIIISSVVGMTDTKLRSLIYRLGNERGFSVSAVACDDGFKVTYKGGKHAKPVRRTHKVPMTSRFNNTVELMQWDVPYPFNDLEPDHLRVLASKHPLNCLTVTGNTLVKRSLMVGKHDGKVAVLFKGEPVLTLDATHKTRLNASQQVQIDDTLAAYRGKA